MKYSLFQNGGTVEGRVNIDGLTLVGPLKLLGVSTENLHAVNKEYVDNKVNNLDASKIVSGFMPVARMPALTGDFISLSGTGVISLKNSGVTPGTYTKVTVNAGGLVTNGGALIESDIPNLGWEKITSGKPTTLTGYGITDAASKTVGVVNGNITLAADPVDPDDVATKRYVDLNSSNGVSFAVGDVISYESEVTPNGFLRANGGEVSKTTYAALYALIGDSFADVTASIAVGNGRPWQRQYYINNDQTNDITGWMQIGNLPAAVRAAQAIVTKNRVYLFGGDTGSYTSDVYTAPIDSNGNIAAWSAATSLPEPLVYSQAVVTKNRVYLLGGYSNTLSPKVYTAVINSDGTLGAWSTAGDLPGILGASQAVVIKNKIYLMGGYNATTYTSVVYKATINEDGTIGAWSTAVPLPSMLRSSQAIVTKNRVYLLGGEQGGFIPVVYSAPVDNEGVIGEWSAEIPLPEGIAYSQAFVTKNRAYLIGGYTTSGKSVVYTAPINADGTLGTWGEGTALPVSFGTSQLVATKNKIYLLGGYGQGGYTAAMYKATIQGGLNDYSPYYDGTVTGVGSNPDTFKLPDYTTVSNPVGKYYVKF